MRATIKIIDDDVEIADNLAAILDDAGYTTGTLYTTEGAVPALEAAPPDLLVLDVMFPDNPAAGFDLARKLRQHATLKTLPIILLTSINQEFPMDFSAGDIDPDWMPVDAFIEKPVTPEHLLATVSELLER